MTTSVSLSTPNQSLISKKLREARALLISTYQATFRGCVAKGTLMLSSCGGYRLRYTIDRAETYASRGSVVFEYKDEFTPVLLVLSHGVPDAILAAELSCAEMLSRENIDIDAIKKRAMDIDLDKNGGLPYVMAVDQHAALNITLYPSSEAAKAAARAVIRPQWIEAGNEDGKRCPNMPDHWQWAYGLLRHARYMAGCYIGTEPLAQRTENAQA